MGNASSLAKFHTDRLATEKDCRAMVLSQQHGMTTHHSTWNDHESFNME